MLTFRVFSQRFHTRFLGQIRLELPMQETSVIHWYPQCQTSDWNIAFSFPSGAGVNPNTGVRLLPGESRQIDVKLQPSPNATVGFFPLTFVATSLQNPSFSVQEQMQYQVSADRIPFIHIPEMKPKCAPGSSCAFFIDVKYGQATDVLIWKRKSLDANWTVSLHLTNFLCSSYSKSNSIDQTHHDCAIRRNS